MSPRRVAMLSLHTSPLAQPGHGDGGGMNVYVALAGRRPGPSGRRVRPAHPGRPARRSAGGARSSRACGSCTSTRGPGVRSRRASCSRTTTSWSTPRRAGSAVRAAPTCSTPTTTSPARWPTRSSTASASPWSRPSTRWPGPSRTSGSTTTRLDRVEVESRDRPLCRRPGRVDRGGARPPRRRLRRRGRAHRGDPAGRRPHRVHPGRPASRVRRHWKVGDDPVLLVVGPDPAPEGLRPRDPHARRARPPTGPPRGRRRTERGRGRGRAGPPARRSSPSWASGDRVRFEPPRAHDDLAAYYRAADVVLVPSRTESFGLVALEAAACGVPGGGHGRGWAPLGRGARRERLHRRRPRPRRRSRPHVAHG